MTSETVKSISSSKAGKPIGHYSQGTIANGMIFVSGQGPVDPATGTVHNTRSVADQTRLTLANVAGVLESGGATWKDVCKVNIFLKDMETFGEMNTAFAEVLGEARPARTAVQVARLPGDIMVEIECVAVVPK